MDYKIYLKVKEEYLQLFYSCWQQLYKFHENVKLQSKRNILNMLLPFIRFWI